MATSPLMAAINQIADEKGLDTAIILETIEAALAAAYRKDYGTPDQVIRAEFDPETLETKMFEVFSIVEDALIEEPAHQITLLEARKIRKSAEIGEEVERPLPVHADFGRIAAQTAKQVIIQRLREAEREMLYAEFKEKENTLVNGNIQQIEGDIVIVNLGKINALMLPTGQIKNERYYIGQRIKVYIQGVEETAKGPKVIVSRADTGFIKALFALEVPEIASEVVEIVAIAREAGGRTKMAVTAHQEGIDPVGSCVGQRGSRVQAVLAEIGDEKIDIILHSTDPERFIANALAPAKPLSIKIDEETHRATVEIEEEQLSLSIGRGGQNVRLASKLTGYSIDILRQGETADKVADEATKDADEEVEETESETETKTETDSTSEES